MDAARQALEDYETANGHASTPERARLNKEFNTAAAVYLNLTK